MKDLFVTVLTALTTKIQDQAATIEVLQETADLVYELRSELETVTSDLNEVSGQLFSANERARDRGDYVYWKATAERLQEELNLIKLGDEKVRLQNADAYMAKEGYSQMKGEAKIPCIKAVRALTNWGLKDSKDYCQAWLPTIVAEVVADSIPPSSEMNPLFSSH